MQQIWCKFGAVTHRGFGARQNRHLVGIESDKLGGGGAVHFSEFVCGVFVSIVVCYAMCLIYAIT